MRRGMIQSAVKITARKSIIYSTLPPTSLSMDKYGRSNDYSAFVKQNRGGIEHLV